MTKSLSMIWWNWLIGKTKTKRLLYKYVTTGFQIPWSVLREMYYQGHRGRSYLEEELTKSHNISKYQPEVARVSEGMLKGHSKEVQREGHESTLDCAEQV